MLKRGTSSESRSIDAPKFNRPVSCFWRENKSCDEDVPGLVWRSWLKNQNKHLCDLYRSFKVKFIVTTINVRFLSARESTWLCWLIKDVLKGIIFVTVLLVVAIKAFTSFITSHVRFYFRSRFFRWFQLLSPVVSGLFEKGKSQSFRRKRQTGGGHCRGLSTASVECTHEWQPVKTAFGRKNISNGFQKLIVKKKNETCE